jgi:PAS domain S-box-containing protein
MPAETERDCSGWFGVRTRYVPRWIWVLGLIFCVLNHVPASAQPAGKNILVIYSFSNRGVYSGLNDLKSKLQAAIPWPIDFYIEYLEGRRIGDKEYENSGAGSFQHTYGGTKLDLVIVEDDPALDFAMRHRDALFPGVPIVFFDVDSGKVAGQKMWPGVTGVTAPVDVQGTINLVLHLHPNTSTIAILSGNSDYERYWLARVHAALAYAQNKDRSRVNVVDLVALPASQLFERIRALPPQTVVLFQLAPQESPQPAVGIYEMGAWVGQRLPTYCIFPRDCLTEWGVGGVGYDGVGQLSLVAEEAKQIFSGDRPENIPVKEGPGHLVKVDWRALQRWHIPESSLPPGSLIQNRQPTLWDRYRNYVIAAIVLTVVQTLLIVGLLWQRARKRRVEAVLRESEKRFRVLADSTPSLVWMCDLKGRITYLNDRRIAFTGPDPKAGFGDTWISYVHPEDQAYVRDTLSQMLKNRQPFSTEYRLRRSDGDYRWMFDVASPRVNGDGSFGGFIGSAIDTTDQKLAQQALQRVSGQLIEAQEKERSRIARELHDDICQRLALLSVELTTAHRSSNGSREAMKESLRDIQNHCSEIAGDVQSLSHQLHSSKLDYLGISAAIRGFCAELSKQHELDIEFSEEDVPAHLPKDVSLCLFRVAQEALHNAVKYSGVREFIVELSAIESGIRLTVSDAGAGFDVEEAKKNRGLGLVSMQERIHLVRGRLSVESQPGAGTRIIVLVPGADENQGKPANAGDDQIVSATGTV